MRPASAHRDRARCWSPREMPQAIGGPPMDARRRYRHKRCESSRSAPNSFPSSRPAAWPMSPARLLASRCMAAGQDARVLLPGFPAIVAGVRDLTPVGRCSRALGSERFALLRGAHRHRCAPPIPGLRGRCAGAVRPAGQSLRRRDAPTLRRQPPALRAARLGGGAGSRKGSTRRGGPRSCTRTTGTRACPGLPAPRARSRLGAARGRVFTVHNLAYQGQFAPWNFADLGLPAPAAFHMNGLEYHGQVSFMKGGLVLRRPASPP